MPLLCGQATPDAPVLPAPTSSGLGSQTSTGMDSQTSGNSSRLAPSNPGIDPLAGDFAQDGQTQASLSADRIITILQDHPSLLADSKRMVAARMQAQGDSAPDGISDDELFKMIDENEDIRAAFTQQLRTQGLLTSEDLDEIGDSEQDGVADQRTRKPTATRRSRSRSSSRDDSAGDPNAPSATRKPDPYSNMPALRDLYSQARMQPGRPKRFGIDVFSDRGTLVENGSLDVPVGPDYVLGPGDRVSVGLSGGVSQRLTRSVDREGQILLPEAGVLMVAGKTIGDAQQLIRQTLTPYFHDVKVDIALTHIRTVRVYVVGEVQQPGAYDVSSLSTPLNALYAAGGPTSRGSLRSVRHLRGEKAISEIDIYQFLLHGIRSDAERLEPGDTILVPPVGTQVTIAGMVRRPAIYEIKGEKDLSDAIELAGGVLAAGSTRQIRVERIEAHQGRIMLSLDLPDGGSEAEVHQLLGPLGVRDGDRITVVPIAAYTAQTIYLEGHVSRPGKYPFKAGMDVGAILRSYDDVLPEPAERAEIIRLEPPDYRPKVISFALGEVLDKSDPIELKPFDTIRVLGRYDADAPKVTIAGEVLRPGEYPLSQGMTASMLVQMAGGFKRGAYTETGDIATYVVQNGSKISREHETFAVGRALAGDPSADVKLKPSDVVSIRQLTGWGDIGASVVLKGEVKYPGTYGIDDGERLSSVLKRAGGMRTTAYPEGAMLDRTEVRELAEKSRAELIRQIETATPESKVRGTSAGEAVATAQLMEVQQKQILATLQKEQPTGRLVIRISGDLQTWENTEADPELRAGDLVTIPKRPNFVLVTGQIYNPAAIGFASGKSAEWYLRQAGGPNESANKKRIFVVRANGSVLADSDHMWHEGVLQAHLQPGDTLVVPERIVSGSSFWKNLLGTAQVTSSIAVAARIATSF